MKVTKAIREYVENQVLAKAEQSLAELKTRASNAEEAYKKDKDAADAKCIELYKELSNKHGIVLCRYIRSTYMPDDKYSLPDVDAYNKARQKAYGKISSIVTEILATMELGGTKTELIEMINNVEF